MIGALTGLGFGLLATSIFPTASGSETLYALAGMGAVAAAVLGAPISTTLIVFELTGNWQVGLAVMAAVSTSSALTSKFVDKSFFLNQLTRRNLNLISGPQFYLLRNKSVGNVMKKNHLDLIDHKDFEKDIFKKIDSIELDNSLELALHIFEQDNVDYLFVVRPESEKTISNVIGVLYYLDVLKIYTEVLIKNSQEEHS
ncbi:MAG: chloride channel protein [Rhodobacterales bacterium]